MKLITTFLVLTFFLTGGFASAYGQKYYERNPFSEKKEPEVPLESKSEKTTIHLPTLDLCLGWLDINFKLMEDQFVIEGLRNEIRNCPADQTDFLRNLELRLDNAAKAQVSRQKAISQIPETTNFDSNRWQSFKVELDAIRKFHSDRNEHVSRLRENYESEIADLLKENEALRRELERLKSETPNETDGTDQTKTRTRVNNGETAIVRFQSQAKEKLPSQLPPGQKSFLLGKISDSDHLHCEKSTCDSYYQRLIASFTLEDWQQFILFGDLSHLNGHSGKCWVIGSGGGFTEVGGCIDAETGKLLVLLILPEG